MTRKKVLDKTAASLCGLVAALLSANVGAIAPIDPVSSLPPPDPNKPIAAGVPFGPFILYPSVGFQYRHNDNFLFLPTNPLSSDIYILTPTLDFRGSKEGHRYGIFYQAELGRYSDSSADDYNDHFLLAAADIWLFPKGRLGLKAEYLKEHDPRGVGGSEGDPLLISEPDVWHSTRIGGTFNYGSHDSQGRLEFALSGRNKRHDNNRVFTILRDLDDWEASLTFFYKVAPLTSLLVQAIHTAIDYTVATLDSKEKRYFAGVTWQATAKTSGTIKFGKQTKDMKAPERHDFDGGSWAAAITWAPRTYSYVVLETNRKTDETHGTGDFNLRKDWSLSWTHNWNTFWRTKLSTIDVNEQYEGVGGVALREDDIKEHSASITYLMRRWLHLGLSYTKSERESDNNAFDFKQKVVAFTINATL